MQEWIERIRYRKDNVMDHRRYLFPQRVAIKIAYLFVIVFFGASGLLAAAQTTTPTAAIEIVHSRDKYPSGGTYPIVLKIALTAGWMIHGIHESDEGLIPTRLIFEPLPNLTVIGPWFPDAQKMKFDYTSEEIECYADEVRVKAWLNIDAAHQPSRIELKGRLSYQACSESVCRPPESIAFGFPVVVVAQGRQTASINQEWFDFSAPQQPPSLNFLKQWTSTGIWLTLLGIFVGGLALNLTPCIYPLIPITVSYFGGRSEKIRSHKIIHTALYLSGLSLTNSILGVFAALSGGMLGAALQRPVVLIAIAAIMLGLAMSFFGFWELRMPQFLTRVASKNYKGYFGTFFMGLTLGIVAAPCLGPFILGLLTYVGQTADPFLGFIYFFVLSIGMGLPLCILAVFSGTLDRLPKSGEWMIWVRKVMGWVMVAVAAYMIRPLIPLNFLKDTILMVVIIVAGVHLGWLDRSVGSRRFAAIKKAVGLVFGIAGLFLLTHAMLPRSGMVWQTYHPQLLENARKAAKPVLLDFYADWCLPCKELEHRVFRDPRVIKLAEEFVALRLDLTRRHPDQEDILRQFQVRGVPTLIFLDGAGLERTAQRVEAYIDVEEMLQRMRQALD